MRYVWVVLAILALVGVLAGIKAKQIGSLIAMGKEMEKAGPPPQAVGSGLAEEQAWEGTISAVGSVVAAKGVAVTTDAPGVVARIAFDSGAVVRQGQVLVELDMSVERAQIASARARRELAEANVKRSRALLEANAIARQQVETEEAALRTSSTDLEALQAQIEKKSIKAPFAGRVGLRLVNLGQFLSPGTSIATLEAVENVYVDFTLPQQRLSDLKIGMPVRISLSADAGADGTLEATIAAFEGGVDAVTRSLKIRAAVPNKDERLRPGMFVRVAVMLPERAKTVTIPATAVVHASYGDSVFVVEEKKQGDKPTKVARQQFVRIGEARGDFVSVLDGVQAGQQVVTAGAFKLRNGGPITIDNTVKRDAQLEPRVENR